MKSQLSRRERIFQRIFTWSYVALILSHLSFAWLLQGNAEALWRWLNISNYLWAAFATLSFCGMAIVVRDRGIMPAILVFMGGGAWSGFAFFPRGWLLLLSITLFGAGGILAARKPIREQFDRMRLSYREIAQSDKT